MSRSSRHVDRYTDIRRDTQADLDRAAMWKEMHERKGRNAKIKDRLTTWFVIGCLLIVVKMLWNAAAA
ncbi:hypothetical protein BRC2024_HCTLARHO_CDS_0031 [Acinetobacter phage vB_AbaS_Silvergun]